jgi:translation initiation factor 2-alpha kinase 1
MKLCEKTLRNFLDERNESGDFVEYYGKYNLRGENIPLKIFLQICNGLSFIHQRNITHHDIKPANVFISYSNLGDSSLSNVLFQLGDFGLACPLDSSELTQNHNGIGTRLYAASEQLNGKICTKKSDIYSMGIILIELLIKCTTMMECLKKVEKLKKGEPLNEIDLNLSELIIKLLAHRYDTRPDIDELIKIVNDMISHSTDEVIRLRNIIDKKDKQIDDLMEQIKTLKSQLSIE